MDRYRLDHGHEPTLANEHDARARDAEPAAWPGKRTRAGAAASGDVDQRTPDLRSIRAALGGGAPLPAPIATEYGRLLGLDLSDVRLHRGGDAGMAARDLGALAFTHGTDIALGDELDPASPM